jgi:hypothetical protein
MSKRVYKLIFSKSSYDLNDDYERLSDHEKERIAELDADTYFDYDDDDECYNCYVITSPQEIERYLKILTSNLISNNCSDLSDDVLKGNINLAKDLKSMVTTTTTIKYSFFIDDIDEWILNNLDIDIVLDRISDIGGIEKLSSIEKEFLKNFQL